MSRWTVTVMNDFVLSASQTAPQRSRSYRKIPRILCATDLSPRCEAAVRRAILLAKQMDALLLLLHVVDEAGTPQEIVGLAERAQIALQARQLTSAAEVAVRVGAPSGAIARVIDEWGPDLVVLGASRERAADQFFGTTAERVVRVGARPVLRVNLEPAGPYREVLLACDPSEAVAQLVREAEELGLLEGTTGSIVQVLGQATHSTFYPEGATQLQLDQMMQSLRWSARRDLIAQLDAAGLASNGYRIIQKHGTATDAIAGAVESVKPQLLVIGATRRPALKRFLGTSVMNGVLRAIDRDVLIASTSAARQPRSGQSRLIPDEWSAQWPTYW